MRPKVKVWVFLLLAGLACRVFPQQFTNTQFIKTDAEGGIFQKDQIFTFELWDPGWFRILLDERETYRGRGPAYQELGIPQDEEGSFTLRAEYYTPGGELAENLSWYIYIDKKAPSLPDLEYRNTREGFRITRTGGEADIKIRALSDIDGNLVFFPNLADQKELPTDFLPSDSFQALVWAEDLAGNCSEFRSEFFDISFVRIENPVPGEWLNQQTLIITGSEGKSIYWTSDGTHPLEAGGTGRLYRGPVRVTREGRVQLRIAWREADGRILEDRIVYSVAPNGGNGSSQINLDSLGKAEENAISSPITLNVPEGWFWSIGNTPREQLDGKVTLRPEPLLRRTAVLQLCPPPASTGGWGTTGVYRFAYYMDGGAGSAWQEITAGLETIKESYLYPIEDKDAFPPLRLVSAGRSRVIVWPDADGYIYYTWGGIWHEGKGPLIVPLQGGNLRWFVLEREIRENEEFPGPFSTSVMAQPGRRETPRGRIAYRNYRGSQNWEYVSSLLDFTPDLLSNPGPDVCDGEDLVWAFISSGGKILEQQRRTRMSPPVPGIDGIPDMGWTREPVEISVVSGEDEYTGIVEATFRYASGVTEQKSGALSLVIDSPSGELAEVTVEAYLLDSIGNWGPKAVQRFTLDPKTIYVSSEQLVQRPSGGAMELRMRGDLDNPFTDLEDAIAFALTHGIGNIRIAGKLELNKAVTVNGSLAIEGGWQWKGGKTEASVISGNDFCWNLRPGAALKISGFRLERQRGNVPLIRAGRNGKVDISGVDITSQGPLLYMDSGRSSINDSRVQLRITGEQRIAALSAVESSVEIINSGIQLEGNYGLLIDLRGGSFSAAKSSFSASGGRTASLIVLNGTRGDLNGLTLGANAVDYASCLEASGSDLLLTEGSIEVNARDASAVLLERCSAVILGTRFQVSGAFSARALEIRGPFPLVQNCSFSSTGRANRAEVFSGTEVPKAGSIAGNSFTGFTHIWGPGWPMERLSVFNRDYASPEKPNSSDLRP